MELKCNRNCHSKYRLEYHLILVTKYRKPCITPEMLQYLRRECQRLLELNGIELLEMNGETDHIHLLFSAPPGLDTALRRDGIAIRNCANYSGLGPGWYRTAVRLHEENAALLTALRRCMEDPSWH